MNKAVISFVIVVGLLASCNNAEHGLPHGDERLAGVVPDPLAYTLYTHKSELFVEFKPLIVGEVSKFAAHFTQLGKNFKAVAEGSVTVSLIGNETKEAGAQHCRLFLQRPCHLEQHPTSIF